jgi:histidinol-phosphate aminotransferase
MAMENNQAWPSWLPIRSELADLKPYGAPQISGVRALNTNENPYDLPKKVVAEMLEALPQVLANLNRYPDRDAVGLREALAKYLSKSAGIVLGSRNIWAANGSNEILQTLMLACGGRGALGFTPSYSVHPLIAKATGTNWISGDREASFKLDVKKSIKMILEKEPGITFITTPNNPTGTSTPYADLEELAITCRKIKGLLVVDEAYAEFSKEMSAVNLIAQYPNVVIVRTMSKAFAFAGARVGYAVCNEAVVDAMLVTRLPYHLSSTTQALALVALDNSKALLAEVDALIAERDRVSAQLTKLGFEVSPSSANFLLFSGFKGDSKTAWESLVAAGILVRDVGLSGYLRVTIGLPSENDEFLTAIAALRS